MHTHTERKKLKVTNDSKEKNTAISKLAYLQDMMKEKYLKWILHIQNLASFLDM